MTFKTFFYPIFIILAFIIILFKFINANLYNNMKIFGSSLNIKSARTLSISIILCLLIFLQFVWKLMAYSSIVHLTCLQLLYFKYYVFFLTGKINFVRNTYWKYPQLVMKIFISSYHLAAIPIRYPFMIWNLLYSDYLFAFVILSRFYYIILIIY